MGTTIDTARLVTHGRGTGKSALRLIDAAARQCIADVGAKPGDIDLLLNAGLYHDRNLGEPALAALIQEDLGINPEDPHPDSHGSFSFDIANGACGVLTGLQIVDRFLRAGTIRRALIVAGDANPGHHLALHFPFRAAGAALLCSRAAEPAGLSEVHWEYWPTDEQAWRATVGMRAGKNALAIDVEDSFFDRAGAAAAKVATATLAAEQLRADDVDVVIACPSHPDFVRSFCGHAGINGDRVVAPDRDLHTAGLISAIETARAEGRLATGTTALLVSAGAGITAGAAIYRA